MDKHVRFATRKERAWIRKQRKGEAQHKHSVELVSIDVKALQQIIRDVYEMGKKDALHERSN